MTRVADGITGVVFYRLRDDGTNRYYEVSRDRLTWSLIDQHDRTTHATPSTWGPTILTGVQTLQEPRVLVVHAREYTL